MFIITKVKYRHKFQRYISKAQKKTKADNPDKKVVYIIGAREKTNSIPRKINSVLPKEIQIKISLNNDHVDPEKFIIFNNAQNYSEAVKILKQTNNVTYSWIAESLGMEERTFRNLRDSIDQPPKNIVIATCILFHLLPYESLKLIDICGYSLRNTPTENRYYTIISLWYNESLDCINNILVEKGEKPLIKSSKSL